MHSDGALTVPQLARLAAEQGLDFLAITDHNTVSHHAELGRASARYGVTLIPGQEVTTDTGHAGALGDLGWVDFRRAGRLVAGRGRAWRTLADSASPSVLAAAAEQLGCASIAYTYNDPAVFMEYAIDVAKAARTRGVRNVAVTAGYMCPEPRAEFFEHMDAANIDLKGFTADFYRKVCGAELAHVLETLEYVRHETRVWLEVTTLLIPGLNDSDSELEAMCAWFCRTPRPGRAAALHGVPSGLENA